MLQKYGYIFSLFFLLCACTGNPDSNAGGTGNISISLNFTRVDQAGLDPFKVTATVAAGANPVTGASLSLTVPKGTVSFVIDKGNGSYEFTVTPTATGIYPVTVSYGGAAIRRDALVLNQYETGTGQPLLVPGLVNTDGYEDGITITPDGEYLFIQYGPVYFSGIAYYMSICADPVNYSLYNLFGSTTKDDSNWVFNTIGPYNTPSRPNFPVGAISGGKLTHLNIVIPGTVNGIVLFPTVFYGFKRQSDGTFAQPFKVAFNDSKGANGPFGLSFHMTGPDTADFVLAWDNYFNHLLNGDKPDIYYGTITMNQDTNLGEVAYTGDLFQSITPNITPFSFNSSYSGVKGNPHLYYDGTGTVKSIWTDDEQVTHDITVYVLTGAYPNGTWSQVTLPSKINTAASESQPFFTGTRLYLNRDVSIVYHQYLGGAYDQDSSWGPEVVVLKSDGSTSIGGIFGVGEPTIAVYKGKTYLYFVYVETRSTDAVTSRNDYDLGAAFVELP